MARPNVDIPHWVTGGVQEHAHKYEIDRSEAHARCLLIGLVCDGILPAEIITDADGALRPPDSMIHKVDPDAIPEVCLVDSNGGESD